MPHTIEEMTADTVTFIRALGLEQVNLLGFSLGGGVAQVIAMELAFTGPGRGGKIELGPARRPVRERSSWRFGFVLAAASRGSPRHRW